MTGKDDLERMRTRLLAGEASAPTSRLTRALRAGRNAAGIVARTATNRVLGGDINIDAIESIVELMGELKGISMRAGQIIGTLDSVVPEEIRRALATLQPSSRSATSRSRPSASGSPCRFSSKGRQRA